MKQEYYDYIFKNRSSGFHHPTRDKIYRMFYEFQNNPVIPDDFIKDNFKYLDGEPGILSENDLINLRYTLLNCCFYFCEYLIMHHIDSELVYNSSDYFINQISKITTDKQALEILNDMAQVCHDMLRDHKQVPYHNLAVEKVIRYINQHLYSGVNLHMVAEYTGFTPQYLTTLFKQVTGQALYKYIQSRKIDEAKMMLIHTNKSVSTISSDLGFCSLAHFSNAFKLQTGMPPSDFRNQ